MNRKHELLGNKFNRIRDLLKNKKLFFCLLQKIQISEEVGKVNAIR